MSRFSSAKDLLEQLRVLPSGKWYFEGRIKPEVIDQKSLNSRQRTAFEAVNTHRQFELRRMTFVKQSGGMLYIRALEPDEHQLSFAYTPSSYRLEAGAPQLVTWYERVPAFVTFTGQLFAGPTVYSPPITNAGKRDG